jgi:hypothetical protein
MKKYLINSVTALGVASNSSAAVLSDDRSVSGQTSDWIKNYMSDELPYTLAGHRSHSSHSSHGSHRSSASSGFKSTVPSYQSTPPASTLPAKPKLKGNSSAFVEIAKKVQIKLMAENLYRGSVDGIIGPKTREGILIYQSRNSLPLTGQIDNALLLKMNIR